MSEFSEWQKESTPERKSVTVCFDRTLSSEWEAAEKAAASPGKMLGEKPDASLEELRQRVRERSRTLVFASIGAKRWRDLLAGHPPTKDQRREQGALLDHNPETFPAAALVAACVEPGLTAEEAAWIMDELPLGVANRIWAACLEANVSGSRDPFGEGFAEARRGEPS